MKFFSLTSSLLLTLFILLAHSSEARLQTCKPSGIIKGRNPPPGACSQENGYDCCLPGHSYNTYKCSPPVTARTKATLTLTSFEQNDDVPTTCDEKFHTDDTRIVALSTGWYNGGFRCLHNITISANGRSVTAKVVDECDSTVGCDADNDYQPPCPNNIVDASKAVWKALGITDPYQVGELEITWSDA